MRGVCLIVFGITAACGTDAPDLYVGEPPPSGFARDAGTHSNSPYLSNLREDFVHLEYVAEVSNALLNINQGTLSLPALTFPPLSGANILEISADMTHSGLVEGSDVIIGPNARVSSADALELRATDTVRISGELKLGAGGLTVVAGQRIEVTGLIESAGPVVLLISEPSAEANISGVIVSRPQGGQRQSAGIEIQGRGRVMISGQLRSVATVDVAGGDINLAAYGDIDVVGQDARIEATTADPLAKPGAIKIRSDGQITLADGAVVGPAAYGTVATGGDVELQARRLAVRDGARIEAGGTVERGGSVTISVEESARFGTNTVASAGLGHTGGSLVIRALELELGAEVRLSAGQGKADPGLLGLEVAELLELDHGALVEGADGLCGPGGDVWVTLGGVVTTAPTARIRGGAGSYHLSSECNRTGSGGNVLIQARDVDGLESLAEPGPGAPPGTVRITENGAVILTPPRSAVRTSGYLISRFVDRGESRTGRPPLLVAVSAQSPAETSLRISMQAGDQTGMPTTPWILVGQAPLEELAGARWFRYRVELEGRAFDTPVMDYFDIALE